MSEIISLFTVFSPHLSAATLRQLCEVVFAVLSMTGGVTMRNISRWTSKGGSYRTIQRFYNTVIPWGTLCWVFFREYLFDPESVYLLAGDESIVDQIGGSHPRFIAFFCVNGRSNDTGTFIFCGVFDQCQGALFLPNAYGTSYPW